MASIINSDDGSVSGSAGLKFTSGDDGVLQIQNNGTTAMTVSAAGVTTFAQPPLTAVPAFRGYLSADQSISSGAETKVNIDTVTGDNFFDTNSWFDTTNKRYVPQIAGYYQFNGVIRCEGTSQTNQYAMLFKNGSRYGIYGFKRDSAVNDVEASDIIYLNGSTDYVELWGVITGTSPRFDFVDTSITCYFSGFLVRAT